MDLKLSKMAPRLLVLFRYHISDWAGFVDGWGFWWGGIAASAYPIGLVSIQDFRPCEDHSLAKNVGGAYGLHGPNGPNGPMGPWAHGPEKRLPELGPFQF